MEETGGHRGDGQQAIRENDTLHTSRTEMLFFSTIQNVMSLALMFILMNFF